MKKEWIHKLGFVVLQLLIAVAVVALLILLVVLGLRRYTQHGVEIEVPAITKLYLAEAKTILEAEGLHIEVIDSTYSNKVPLGTIVEQIPEAGSKVKNGRDIYVILNAQTHRPVILPELRVLSLRQATATLHSIGLKIDSIEYKPYSDGVLDIRKEGKSLEPGARLKEGDAIILVVGRGTNVQKVEIPSVIGKTLREAEEILNSKNLVIRDVIYDEEPFEYNKEQYIVYSQSPEQGEEGTEGDPVDLKLSLDIEKTITFDNEDNEEISF